MSLFATAVLYADKPDEAKMRSYLTAAMPQVMAEADGLKSWSVTELLGVDGATPPYAVQALLVWESQEKASAAWKDDRMKEVLEKLKGMGSNVAVVNGNVLGHN